MVNQTCFYDTSTLRYVCGLLAVFLKYKTPELSGVFGGCCLRFSLLDLWAQHREMLLRVVQQGVEMLDGVRLVVDL